MPLHPKARVLLDMLNRIDAPHLFEQPIDVARRNYHKLLFAYRGELVPLPSIRDIELTRKELAGGSLRSRLYRSREHGTQPVLLWFHGGGWTLGDIDAYDGLCRAIAKRADCAVLSVDYRLAPENTYPAAVDDAWFAWQWALRHGADHGLDVTRIAVGGDSAGANLVAVMGLMARDAKQVAPRLQVLVYPLTDQSFESASLREFGEGFFLDRASIAWFQRNYLPAVVDFADWRASPANAASHIGLPPTLIISAEYDPLRDDAVAYADRLQAADVPVRHLCYHGMIHGFLSMPTLFDAADDAISEIAAAMRGACG